MSFIDLHVHSNYSDGTCSPADLAALAANAGLTAFALTDHDTTDGLAETVEAAKPYEIEVVPGIEFSTEYNGIDIHIVGLDFDYQNEAFRKKVAFYRDERQRRNLRMIQRMADDGIDISFEKMTAEFGEGLWTRAHFGRFLLNHGYVKSIAEAFKDYLGDHCKYFIPREKVSPFEAVALIRRYGGIPILAHPFQYHFSDDELRELLLRLIESGLLGMEVYYSGYDEEQVSYLKDLAAELGLAQSGGSDFHGSNKPHISIGTGQGELSIPHTILELLRLSREKHLQHS